MNITVKLFASFRTGRFDVETADYPNGTTVAAVAERLQLPIAVLGIMICNHRHVKLDYELVDGDVLALFPLLGGG
jgi:molybdopterin converting factor small subunit